MNNPNNIDETHDYINELEVEITDLKNLLRRVYFLLEYDVDNIKSFIHKRAELKGEIKEKLKGSM